MKLNIEKNYPGSKGQSGLYQWIVNHIPKFNAYHELFTGTGVIASYLQDPKVNEPAPIFLSEIDPHVVQQLQKKFKKEDYPFVSVSHEDGLNKLKALVRSDGSVQSNCGRVVYCDPPYLLEARKSNRLLYNKNWTKAEHRQFLRQVKKLVNSFVIISGYDSELYNEELAGWYTDTTDTWTHLGMQTEKLWMNFNWKDLPLHQTAFVGDDYKQRQANKRLRERYEKKLGAMPLHKRQMLIEHIKGNLYV